MKMKWIGLVALVLFLTSGYGICNENSLIVDENGNVGIGTQIPKDALTIGINQGESVKIHGQMNFGTIADTASLFVGTTHGSSATPKAGMTAMQEWGGNDTNYTLKFRVTEGGVTSREPMFIKEDGNIGIGTTTPQYDLDVNGDIRGNLISPSDVRWKNNIDRIDNALEKITNLRGVKYKWRDDSKGMGQQIGVIAQEVEEVFPELISTDDQGYKSVAYAKLIAPMIEAIKELKEENELIKRQLTAMMENQKHSSK